MKKIATTSMSSKLISTNSPELSNVVMHAVLSILEIPDESNNKKFKVDIDNIKIEKKPGGSIKDTKLINGIVLDREVVHGGMPRVLKMRRLYYLTVL